MIVAVNRWKQRTMSENIVPWFSYQPIFIPKLQINFAEFPCLLYIESNRVCSTREPVADYGTAKEGLFSDYSLLFSWILISNWYKNKLFWFVVFILLIVDHCFSQNDFLFKTNEIKTKINKNRELLIKKIKIKQTKRRN